MTENMEICYFCGNPNVEMHHIVNGIANRKKSEKYGLKVPLCRACHERVHNNQKLDLKLKKKGQKAFMKTYPDKDFLETFGKNYL